MSSGKAKLRADARAQTKTEMQLLEHEAFVAWRMSPQRRVAYVLLCLSWSLVVAGGVAWLLLWLTPLSVFAAAVLAGFAFSAALGTLILLVDQPTPAVLVVMKARGALSETSSKAGGAK